MEVLARLNNVRSSAQKVRVVADAVRGLSAEVALEMLLYSSKKASKLVKKVLDSAVANADNNHGIDIDALTISRIFVDEGPTLKRWRARAKGRSTRILKRTCHITVAVSPAKTK